MRWENKLHHTRVPIHRSNSTHTHYMHTTLTHPPTRTRLYIYIYTHSLYARTVHADCPHTVEVEFGTRQVSVNDKVKLQIWDKYTTHTTYTSASPNPHAHYMHAQYTTLTHAHTCTRIHTLTTYTQFGVEFRNAAGERERQGSEAADMGQVHNTHNTTHPPSPTPARTLHA